MSATTGKPCPSAWLIRASVSAGSCSGSWFTATTAPSAARRAAVACPIPVVAPVTSATLPSKRRSITCLLSASEDGDRIPGRSGPAGQPQRQADDHELETPFLRARTGDVLELEAVGDEHAHGGYLKGVNRVEDALDVARDRFPVAVRQERCDLALMHPRDCVDVQPGLALARRRVSVIPRAALKAAPMVAGTEDQDVALTQADSLRLLDRFKLRASHGLTWLEPAHASEAGHVEQHAPADKSVAVARHVQRSGALRRHDLERGPAVVDAALVGDMAERIHVGVAVTMKGEAEKIRGKRQRV